jgi:signal transduction histidine kinase
LRIDDRLDTALRNSDAAESNQNAGQWRQLVDILAQNPLRFDAAQIAKGLVRARQMRDSVGVDDRVATIRSLGGRILSSPLVQLLAGDVPPVSAAAIAGAKLSDGEWADLVPHLPVRARGFLRMRGDLGPLTQRALALHAGGDFALPGHVTEAQESLGRPQWDNRAIPIAEVVERIEQWRKDHAKEPFFADAPQLPFEPELADTPTIATEIRFETDDNGTIIWVEGAPRGAIVGIDIARPAFDNGPGPDAYGSAAFRQRMPMENARMRLRGASVVEGDWRMSASPFFDAQSGRFRGFRGIMRRPTVSETADIRPDPVRQAEQLQQILHELRTPLGAIAGFAEIIEQQMFGPVGDEYRGLAGNIVADANQLLAGFDDLSIAAQMDRGELPAQSGVTECNWLVARIAERLHDVSESLKVDVNLVIADPVRPFALDHDMAERLFSRLLSAVIMGCEPGEELNGRFSTEIGAHAQNRFQLSLPKKLAGLSEDEMLGVGPASGGANPAGSPLLGLGFSLRLVRNLSRNVGGGLQFQNESLLVTIPAVRDDSHHYRDQWGE